MSTAEAVRLYKRDRREFWLLLALSYAVAAIVPGIGSLLLALAHSGVDVAGIGRLAGTSMLAAAVLWALLAFTMWARHAPPLVSFWPSLARLRWKLMLLSQLVIVAWPAWSPSADRLWRLLGYSN